MSDSIPLDLLVIGEWAEVTSVEGDESWVSRMSELGIRPGCRIQMLQPGSPCLLLVGGSRLILRGASVTRILVQPVSETQ